MKSKEDLRTELFIEVYSNIKHTMKDTCPWWHSINLEYHTNVIEIFDKTYRKVGDVVNTGTPEGVGMGFKPPKFLKGGESIVTTIEGIGTIKNKVVNYK